MSCYFCDEYYKYDDMISVYISEGVSKLYCQCCMDDFIVDGYYYKCDECDTLVNAVTNYYGCKHK